ncbi:MAG: CRISPR system precrRNA processing endoribonuclease RAMP protein Cas6 [Acidobacteriota bacterium]|nr:CRISPR system precrRNA processing endoribonuclease RAMP protein Cas6 [Acidobacteriota bacterium]
MFPITRLQLKLRLLDDDAPTGYWGSRLRGGYGRVLKDHLCDHQDLTDCRTCPRFGECDYPRLFEPVRTAEESRKADAPLKNQTSLPRPFVIDLPRHFSAEQLQSKRLHFGVTLMGELSQRIEYPVTAFSIFGQMGIEAGAGRRARFLVEDVRDSLNGGRSIFSDPATGSAMFQGAVVKDVVDAIREARQTTAANEPGNEAANETANKPDRGTGEPGDEFEVRFVTPVRIENGQLRDFYDLIYQLSNRIGGLWQMYGKDWPGQSEFYRWRNNLVGAARGVKTTECNLRDFTTARYSHRQGKKLPMYGFVGAMRFSGNLTPFEELLRIGEIVHLGQQTGFGFGRIQLLH